jgi:hypothetical protein
MGRCIKWALRKPVCLTYFDRASEENLSIELATVIGLPKKFLRLGRMILRMHHPASFVQPILWSWFEAAHGRTNVPRPLEREACTEEIPIIRPRGKYLSGSLEH